MPVASGNDQVHILGRPSGASEPHRRPSHGAKSNAGVRQFAGGFMVGVGDVRMSHRRGVEKQVEVFLTAIGRHSTNLSSAFGPVNKNVARSLPATFIYFCVNF